MTIFDQLRHWAARSLQRDAERYDELIDIINSHDPTRGREEVTADPEGTVTAEQFAELRTMVTADRVQHGFGDGMNEDMATYGWSTFGCGMSVRHMTPAELLEELGYKTYEQYEQSTHYEEEEE